jgi:hypothetical protein
MLPWAGEALPRLLALLPGASQDVVFLLLETILHTARVRTCLCPDVPPAHPPHWEAVGGRRSCIQRTWRSTRLHWAQWPSQHSRATPKVRDCGRGARCVGVMLTENGRGGSGPDADHMVQSVVEDMVALLCTDAAALSAFRVRALPSLLALLRTRHPHEAVPVRVRRCGRCGLDAQG